MKSSLKSGLSFGLTSSIITTLGLMMGLYAGTGSRLAVIGAIITIAIADALSDALGMHISTESGGKNSEDVWESTISTFVAKSFFAITFIIPVLLMDLNSAMFASIVWGAIALSGLSYLIAKSHGEKPLNAILEHLLIAAIVIIISYYLGLWVSVTFG